MTFETACAETERVASAAGKAVAHLAGAVRQLHKAASEGDLNKIRRASERLDTMAESARHEVSNASSAWPLSPEEEEQYLRESYATEIMDAAKADGLQLQRLDEGLVAFPSILRIVPGERAVRINRKKVQAVRPSHLVKMLKAIQARKSKATPEHLLEVFLRAYRLVAGKEFGKTVALARIYEALTMLPGSTANYDHTDFVRDLFLLDRSGVKRTKSGFSYSLPASTGTKDAKGTFSFVAPGGETVKYYGIRFSEAPE